LVGITIYEFDALAAAVPGISNTKGLHSVPSHVFTWLEAQALEIAELGEKAWLRLSQRGGHRTVQLASFVGVIRTPDGYQIEVLPKVAKAIDEGDTQAREILIEMLRCLGPFRHIQTESAMLAATRMPLLEVFISEFLRTVTQVIKRGIRCDYTSEQDNLFSLRGKLQIASHLRQNLCRRDRFYTEFDEFSANRPENRLLRTALRRVLTLTTNQANQQLAYELCFVFADIPASNNYSMDFMKVRIDRGMTHYDEALAWTRLILDDRSPLTGTGKNHAPSLLFPMETVFEAFVAKHLSRQLQHGSALQTQAQRISMVKHLDQDWFRLKPDLLLESSEVKGLVLDTKWKLIDNRLANGSDKYGLSQSDFYQLHAYGHNYLNGEGNVVLIYPKTDVFNQALPVFEFPKSSGLKLWVLPFCLKEKRLLLPPCGTFDEYI
jgi:5-methylcytosine-specific restriction enzyme subunit McrC